MAELENEIVKMFEKEEREIMSKSPHQIEYQNGLKVERFEKGVTKISSIPQTEENKDSSS